MFNGYQTVKDSAGNLSDKKVSAFLAPAYVILSLGMDYKPSEHFALLLAPVTGKLIIAIQEKLSDIKKFATSLFTFRSNYKGEFGGFLQMINKGKITKHFNYQSNLELFSNYLHKPQNIDVDWEVLLTLKFTKFFSANLKTNVVYDDDVKTLGRDGLVRPRTQIKQFIGAGFLYSF